MPIGTSSVKIQTVVSEVEMTSAAPKQGENLPITNADNVDILKYLGELYDSDEEDEINDVEVKVDMRQMFPRM